MLEDHQYRLMSGLTYTARYVKMLNRIKNAGLIQCIPSYVSYHMLYVDMTHYSTRDSVLAHKMFSISILEKQSNISLLIFKEIP